MNVTFSNFVFLSSFYSMTKISGLSLTWCISFGAVGNVFVIVEREENG